MKSRCPKMSAKTLGLALIPFVFPMATSAASHIKKAASKEVYAATDASEMQPGFAMPVESEPGAALAAPAVATAPEVEQAPARAAKTQKVIKAQAPAPAIAATTPAPATAVKTARIAAATFDTVPASQSDAILQRIKIVENLVRKYGRAYDYRTHTLKELELIQSTLDSTAAAPAPARAATPATPVVSAPLTAPAADAAPQAESDTIRTGQAAAIEENAEDTNLSALPPPAEYVPNNADEEN